jgi:putative hydrolase of the HAD superfamily
MIDYYKAVIFDLGGTLIHYDGLPLYWGDHYELVFNQINESLSLNLSSEQVKTSIDSLNLFNPRINLREHEVSPEIIFSKVIELWNKPLPSIENVTHLFFKYFRKNLIIYNDTIPTLLKLNNNHIMTGILTDVPTGMPTKFVLEDIYEFNHLIDITVTSNDCGFRKPNITGLKLILEKLELFPNEIVFIGDEEKDIKVAKNFGCKSVLINRSRDLKSFNEDYQIKSLLELKDVIKIN